MGAVVEMKWAKTFLVSTLRLGTGQSVERWCGEGSSPISPLSQLPDVIWGGRFANRSVILCFSSAEDCSGAFLVIGLYGT